MGDIDIVKMSLLPSRISAKNKKPVVGVVDNYTKFRQMITKSVKFY